jgi:D-amino-acid oxidase
MASISVLGGGISGVTTAVMLRLFGHRVTIYTDRRADCAHGSHDPMTASLYPAASVIPHAVTVDNPTEHLADAQAFFEVLRCAEDFGVRRQLHFEVFEAPEPDPAYAPALIDYRRLADSPLRPPSRRDASTLYGWHFQVYFAETPIYLRRLFRLFETLGGRIIRRTVTPDALPDIPGDILVNALGGAAPTVFPDERPASYIRGILVLIPSTGLPRHCDTGQYVSYNYTPSSAAYARADGSPAGVYAYPRRDVWVLGGTKQDGQMDDDGRWRGEPLVGETVDLPLPGPDDGRIPVPRPILDLNREILADLTGEAPEMSDATGVFGYRYARDPDGDGVRLGTGRSADGRLVAHNTGHGGAGVTLSWSSALRVARALQSAGVPMNGSAPVSGPGPADGTLDATTEATVRLARRLRELAGNRITASTT